MASRVVGQHAHQHHFRAILLLLAARLGSQLQANAQQEYKSNTQGYSCSDSGTKSCNTFLLYRAQEKYSTVLEIAELFNTNVSMVAKLNNLSAKQTLGMEKAVIIPLTCRCWANSISFANISYTIVEGDFFYDVNVNNFESLSTVDAIEAANSKLNPWYLQLGQKIVLPLRCACPSKAQISKGVKSLVTYPVGDGDIVDAIASRFGVSSADVISANILMAAHPRINTETTLVIPIYSSQPSYRDPHEDPLSADTPEAPSPGGGLSGQTNGGESNNKHIWVTASVIVGVIVGAVIVVGLICLAIPTTRPVVLRLLSVLLRRKRQEGRTEDVRLLGPRCPPCPPMRSEASVCRL